MTAIEVKSLAKSFGSTQALRGTSFSVPAGSVTGFLGPNGAGKTTTLRILAGLARADAGEVRVAGIDVRQRPDKVRHHIGYLPQQPAFYDWMTGEEFLRLAGELFGMRGRALAQRVSAVIEQVGLQKAARRPVAGYSGGMRQRLGVAQALINRPEVLLLDEPAASLDPLGRRDLLNLIRTLAGEAAVMFSTHILADADQICDHFVMIHDGRVVLQASRQELSQYSNPAIAFAVEEQDFDPAPLLGSQPWAGSWQRDGEVWLIHPRDLVHAQAELPRLLLAHGLTLRHFSLRTPSLEDVFFRVVNEQ